MKSAPNVVVMYIETMLGRWKTTPTRMYAVIAGVAPTGM